MPEVLVVRGAVTAGKPCSAEHLSWFLQAGYSGKTKCSHFQEIPNQMLALNTNYMSLNWCVFNLWQSKSNVAVDQETNGSCCSLLSVRRQRLCERLCDDHVIMLLCSSCFRHLLAPNLKNMPVHESLRRRIVLNRKSGSNEATLSVAITTAEGSIWFLKCNWEHCLMHGRYTEPIVLIAGAQI